MAGPIDASTQKRGFIKCYGLFWSADEVEWSPGSGNRGAYRLLGRVGQRRPSVAVCDFRQQRGIYVLYDHYGPYYVGLARDQDIGNRLRSHLRDHHQGKWDRFSWFGFRRVLNASDSDGMRKLGKYPNRLLTESKATIGDIEALLIQALGTHGRGNELQMKFASAQRWTQIQQHEADEYLDKVSR